MRPRTSVLWTLSTVAVLLLAGASRAIILPRGESAATTPQVGPVVAGNRDFALRLYHRLSTGSGNLLH